MIVHLTLKSSHPMNALQVIEYSFAIAMSTIVYIFILGDSGMILEKWFNYINETLCVNSWLYKILGGCEMCTAGQVALWFYFFDCLHVSGYLNLVTFTGYHLGQHIVFVSLTIFLTLIFKTIHKRCKDLNF